MFEMKKAIFLCASMAFYKDLISIEKQLQAKGFKVNIPESLKIMKKKNDFEPSHFKGKFTPEQKAQFIQKNFRNIVKSESILVVNNEKNGIKGYIGANVLMEIGLAFHKNKKIYILNAIDKKASHMEELLAFNVNFINNDLDKIK
jgi:hypothetical protein